jgi:chromosome segregation ATPase
LRAVKHVFGHKIKSMASKAEWMEFNDFIEDPQNFMDLRKDRKVALIQHGNPGGTASALDGILFAMIDDFTNEIHDEVQADEKNEKSFQELKTAMGSQISAAKIQIDDKTVQKATAAQKVTDATTSVSAAKSALAEAQAYLKTLNTKCAESATAYESRTKLRTEEQASVAKAIEILSSDKTKKLEKKTLAFLQLSAQSNHATEALKSAGKRLKADKLVKLATQLRGASLAKVVQAIAKMMEDLKKEAADDVKKRDSCTDDLNANDLAQKEKQRTLQDVTGKISVLQTNSDQVTADQKALKTRVSELQAQIANTTATRKKETSDFFTFMDDQKSTQIILKQAIEALNGVYQATDKATLVEVSKHRSEADEDAAPVEKTYNPNSGGAGVVTLLSQIIEDSKALQKKAKQAEADAEATFETALNDLNSAVATAQKDLNEKVSKEASLKSELTQSKQTKQATSDAIDQLTATNMALHEDCDFLLKNFDIRQKARQDELDALSSAKALLGSSPAASETDTTASVSDDE